MIMAYGRREKLSSILILEIFMANTLKNLSNNPMKKNKTKLADNPPHVSWGKLRFGKGFNELEAHEL